jgi:hypothetical protein
MQADADAEEDSGGKGGVGEEGGLISARLQDQRAARWMQYSDDSTLQRLQELGEELSCTGTVDEGHPSHSAGAGIDQPAGLVQGEGSFDVGLEATCGTDELLSSVPQSVAAAEAGQGQSSGKDLKALLRATVSQAEIEAEQAAKEVTTGAI